LESIRELIFFRLGTVAIKANAERMTTTTAAVELRLLDERSVLWASLF
jgi:hypothetical protein